MASPSTYSGYVYEAFGDTTQQIKLRSNLRPEPLQPSQVRIKVHSAAINPIDYKLIEFGATRLSSHPTADKPFRIGYDVSGEVVQVGQDVKRFQRGDLVFGSANWATSGTLAEFVAMEEAHLVAKPSKLSFNEAAGVPLAALTSYQALTAYANLQPGQRVLVIGASGGTGSFAVQIARGLGAHVIATASFRNEEYVKALGAHQVIDYTKAKWVDVLAPHSIDVIYDCGFEPNSWNDVAQQVLKQGTGQFATIQPVTDAIASPIGATLHQVRFKTSGEDLSVLAEFADQGKLSVPIDAVFPFGDVAGAFQKLKSGRARGKIVVQVIQQ